MIKTFVRRTLLLSAISMATLPIRGIDAAELADGRTNTHLQYRLGPQDKVSIKVYEWRPARDEIYEWTAFKAEYVVNAAGSLSLPLLGEVAAEGISTSELSQEIGDRLKHKMGLIDSPDVTVEVVQFRPFYIVGAVDKPGEYPYRPGLSVLEAYAIAGGKPRNGLGTRLEREAITTRGELTGLALETQTLSVRMARLKAELANAATLSFPTDIELKSASGELDRAIKQEKLVFDMRRESFNTQITALDQLRSYLEQEAVSLEKQLEVHKLEADSVKSEYDMVTKLYQKGLTSVPRKLALERNMAQVDGERLRLETSLMRARQEIGKTKISIAELQAKRSTEISTEMQTTQTRLNEIKNRSETATSLLYDTENVAPQAFAEKGFNSAPPVFDILRHEASNVKQRNVSQNETIQPGDTVFVEQPRPEYGPPKSEMSALPSKGSPAIAPTATISASSDRLN